jgi:hypothetical protein
MRADRLVWPVRRRMALIIGCDAYPPPPASVEPLMLPFVLGGCLCFAFLRRLHSVLNPTLSRPLLRLLSARHGRRRSAQARDCGLLQLLDPTPLQSPLLRFHRCLRCLTTLLCTVVPQPAYSKVDLQPLRQRRREHSFQAARLPWIAVDFMGTRLSAG